MKLKADIARETLLEKQDILRLGERDYRIESGSYAAERFDKIAI